VKNEAGVKNDLKLSVTGALPKIIPLNIHQQLEVFPEVAKAILVITVITVDVPRNDWIRPDLIFQSNTCIYPYIK